MQNIDDASRPLAKELQEFLDSRELFGWQLGLDRVLRLSRFLGNPHRRYPIIHIAGTNGKGSTAAMLEAVLRSSGLRTGLYTSPHLVHLTERIRINGLSISIDDFEAILKHQKRLLEQHQATYFEALTTVAFSAFAGAKIDVAVVEVGLGGRLDATNIVRPAVCVIPSIGFDHQKFLGRTLTAIAAEKAGILKRRVPCVIGNMSARAAAKIAERAKETGSRIFDARELCKVRKYEVSDGANVLSISAGSKNYDRLHCKLVGQHQINNVLCAVLAIHLLNDRGFEISESAMRQGLQNVDWPGRFQIFHHEPTIILDVAHNSAGMKALVQTLGAVYPESRPVVVIGILADKDYQGVLRAWRGVAAHLLCCRVNSPRGLPVEKLHNAAQKLDLPSSVAADVVAALSEAKMRAGRNGIVCVTGSHYVVGQLLENVRADEKIGKNLLTF